MNILIQRQKLERKLHAIDEQIYEMENNLPKRLARLKDEKDMVEFHINELQEILDQEFNGDNK